jgi:hypothetical protein
MADTPCGVACLQRQYTGRRNEILKQSTALPVRA